MDRQGERPPLDRRQFLLRSAALVAVAAGAIACQHTDGGATEDAEEYDSMQITPPAAAGGM